MSMITATAWVPRGFAATFPTKYDVDEREMARISKLAQLKLDDAKADFESAQKGETIDTATDDEVGSENDGVRIPQSNG